MTTGLAPTLPLRNGAEIPQVGLGTWPMDDAEAERVVADALQAGYRLVDTAEAYGNERGVGRGLRASGVPREDVFVTTKFNKRWHGEDLAEQALEQSAERLGVDVIDLLLVHWPNPQHDRYVDAVRGLGRLLEDGRLRAIGVSNFKPSHLQRVLDETGLVPDVNQIQLSPAVTRAEARAFHEQHGIVTESWSPIGGEGAEVLAEPVVRELAERYGRTPAQVVLRWHVELGLLPIPKSSNPRRLRENLAIFDFSLAQEDVEALSALDRGEQAATDSDRSGH